MKLEDLKTGMRFVDRKNEEWIVLNNVKTPYGDVEDMYISRNGRWMSRSSYNEDLTIKNDDKKYDIMKVYAQNKGQYINGGVFKRKTSEFDLIWERDDKKEMTISEIEKELGYSIKIIKEN